MEQLPRIWVDWNDYLDKDIVDLNFASCLKCFEEQGAPLEEGVKIRLFGDDVEADALVVKLEHDLWGAKIVEGTLINVDFP